MSDPQIRLVIGDLKDFTEKKVKRLTLEVTSQLIERTPVDTGWARANWVPNIGSPIETDLSFIQSEEDRLASVGSARSDQQAGIASVFTYRLDQGPVFVSNNVPYIQVLNSGSSDQAPAAFVEAAIQTAVNIVLREQ